MNGSIHEAEDLVRRLPDVAGCRIEADPAGNVFLVRVTTHGARRIEDVRADVVTLLGTEAGLDVLEEQVAVAVAPVEMTLPRRRMNWSWSRSKPPRGRDS